MKKQDIRILIYLLIDLLLLFLLYFKSVTLTYISYLIIFLISLIMIIFKKEIRKQYIIISIINICFILSTIIIEYLVSQNGNACSMFGNNYDLIQMDNECGNDCIDIEDNTDENGKIWCCCKKDE